MSWKAGNNSQYGLYARYNGCSLVIIGPCTTTKVEVSIKAGGMTFKPKMHQCEAGVWVAESEGENGFKLAVQAMYDQHLETCEVLPKVTGPDFLSNNQKLTLRKAEEPVVAAPKAERPTEAVQVGSGGDSETADVI